MKIFGIGLTRTATTSLTEALKILGYSSVHCPMSYEEIDQYDASTDTPVAARFEFLDLLYPNSKFILTTRDIDSWIKSAASLQRSTDDPLWKLETRSILWKSLVFNKEKFIQGYYTHHSKVLEYFTDRKQDLLILDLQEIDKFKKLCYFLNKSNPDIEYPHLNKWSLL
ncbi:MAG: hypothetical protein EBU90_05945 [Proteobacteria bacterium]|nr:hypothetical protein [Pseudomonadota bacterium]NBP15051.1 hypothetical protein [bacterium]